MKVTLEIGVTAMHDNAIIAVSIFSSQVEFIMNNPEELENSLMTYIQNINPCIAVIGQLRTITQTG